MKKNDYVSPLECKKCQAISEKWLEENPDKNGRILCLDCYEEYKNYIVYVNLPFDPDSLYDEKDWIKRMKNDKTKG